MVFLLIENVLPYAFNVGWAHRKRAVTLLPTELLSSNLFVNPCGRVRFQVSQEIIKAVRRFQSNKQMNVIYNSADSERYPVHAFHDSAHVRVETIAPLRSD